MDYDGEEIEVTYEVINGQKVPIYKIPTGMSGSTKIPNYSNDSDENNDSPPQINNSIYDEENIHYTTDRFIDIQ